MTTVRKCQAEGGVENCTSPNCPEKMMSESFSVPSFFTPETFPAERKIVQGAWSNSDTVLFKTIIGSKLYGLSHADSDNDYYIITPTRYVSRKLNVQQKITGKEDIVAVDFRSFVELARKGAPQALEAMFSRASKSEFFEDYRTNYYASDPEVIHTYMRTIKSFSLTEVDGFKRRRHALRLALNLEELLYTGRFNPTLSSSHVSKISSLAKKEGNDYIKELKALSPIEVDWKFEN